MTRVVSNYSIIWYPCWVWKVFEVLMIVQAIKPDKTGMMFEFIKQETVEIHVNRSGSQFCKCIFK